MLKVATWNVNSLRVRLQHVQDWLSQEQPDILALQETKIQDDDFPTDVFVSQGYHALISGQKTYNGVAILSKQPGQDAVSDLPGFPDPQRRLLSARYGSLRVVDVYVPNGAEVGSEKYAYKLAWLGALIDYLKELLAQPTPLVLLGDFNIAPEDRDVHDPAAWEGNVLVSEPERARFRELLSLNLTDTFRLFTPDPGHFSWWDYRALAFRRNHGLRIDHILANALLASHCTAARIDKNPRRLAQPSDHAPVVAEFDLSL
jgi:exodeoxyribonuclease-3